MKKVLHTFVVLAYKESIFLEDCIKSVINQRYRSNVDWLGQGLVS